MKTESLESKFENFKKEYISEMASEIASSLQFIENVVGIVIVEYIAMFKQYFNKNENIINIFFKNRDKKSKDKKDEYVLGWLGFISAIPKLLVFKDNNFEINYTFLRKYFFIIKDENKINNIYDSLKDTQKKVITKDVIKLYEYGNFILNFINNFYFRKTVAIELLDELSKSDDKTDNIIKNTIKKPVIMKNKENQNEWKPMILN